VDESVDGFPERIRIVFMMSLRVESMLIESPKIASSSNVNNIGECLIDRPSIITISLSTDNAHNDFVDHVRFYQGTIIEFPVNPSRNHRTRSLNS